MARTCDGCSKCCRDISVEIDRPTSFEEFEETKWMIMHKNVTVYIDSEDDWLVEFQTECEALDENNRCKIYNDRFSICKDHDPKDCVSSGEETHYEMIFRTPEDIDKYMKKVGFYEEYMKEKKKRNSGNCSK